MSVSPKLEAFENVKEQIGACGIWCGSCVVGNGTLRELSRKYARTLFEYGLHKWGPKDFNWEEFSKGLESIEHVPLCPGCWRGGGRDNCELRSCASRRGLLHCTACPDLTSCNHATILEHMRSGAATAALFVLPEGGDPAILMKEWLVALRAKWPCSVLFADDR